MITYDVKVPATSANLGPGFDTLGMAVELFLNVQATFGGGEGIDVRAMAEGGEDRVPRDERNLIYQSMVRLFQAAKEPMPNVHLVIESDIPLTSGLGSSAAAIVAGVTLANAYLGAPFSSGDLLHLATLIEGHPDNVAPALLGGLVAATYDKRRGRVYAHQVHSAPGLSLLALRPPYELATEKARQALPDMYSREDVVYALGQLALLLEAIHHEAWDLLRLALNDRLHEPYRLPLIPGAERLLALGQEAPSLGMYLSGAGPTLMALFKTDADRAAWLAWTESYGGLTGWRALPLRPTPIGATLTVRETSVESP
ncbi:MAG: homoserine kinase [Candidatus Carbobacillus altaicus]|nr:homoserine kinase [Candidatus Carbobacillus altaicus]